jgi:putative permease
LSLAFFVLYFLGNILTPFLISIIFAYLLVGMQSRLEKYGLGKSLSLILTYAFFLLIGIALMIWLIPLVSQQLQSLIVEIPKWLNSFMFFVQDIPTKYPDLVSSDQIATFLQTASSQITSISQDFLKASISGIQNTLLVAINLILLPILVFFFLFDRKNIIDGMLKVIPGKREMFSNVWTEMDIQLSNYVRGKTIEIFIVGIVAAIIFSSLGLKYSALLSVLVGLSVIIPYVGAFLVTIPVVIVGLLQFGLGTQFYLLVGLYLLLQALDGNLLVPLIFSETVKLHPVVIILAVFIFGSMFGFWGVFFSIPIATFIKAVWNAWPSALE